MTSEHTPSSGLRASYDTSGPGKFEGQHKMVAFIYDNDLFDRDSGTTESPTGWFAQAGRWVIGSDSNGFVYGHRFLSRVQAHLHFNDLDREYCDWLDAEDNES